MKNSVLTNTLLIAFPLMAVFGFYMPTTMPGGHEAGCPFVSVAATPCVALLEHVEHWQLAFTAVLGKLVLLILLVFVFLTFLGLRTIQDPQYERYRLRAHISLRPPLMQELFSQGILHRKESQVHI